MLGRYRRDHGVGKLTLDGVSVVGALVDGRYSNQHAIGNPAAHRVAYLCDSLVRHGPRDVVTHNGPIRDRLEPLTK